MTVSSSYSPHRYKPGSAMAAEAIPFQYFDADDIVVLHIADSDGATTELVRDTDYVIAGDGMALGGTIKAEAAWPADDIFEVQRATARVQEADIAPHEPLPAEDLEATLDRQVLALQEQDRILDRTLKVPDGETIGTLPAKADRLGKYLAFDAAGNPIEASGTGADLDLRGDLASTAGLSMLGSQPFSGSIIPDGSTGQQAMQALETELDAQAADITTIESDIDPLREAGDAGRAALAAYGKDEARTAIGLQEKRITMNVDGKNYILNAEDIAPAIHYGLLSGGQTARLDVAGARLYNSYVIVNESGIGGVIELDCGAENHFRGDGISPSDSTQTVIKLFPSQVAILRRTGGNRIHIEIDEQTYWITASTYRYRRLRGGTYEVIYTRTASINATTESTSNNIDTALDLSNAQVLSVTVNPDAGGAAPPDLPPQVTKLGTTHSLNAYQFAIRNPNAGAISHPIVVHFLNVTGP